MPNESLPSEDEIKEALTNWEGAIYEEEHGGAAPGALDKAREELLGVLKRCKSAVTFTPTHQHAEGGLYQVVGHPKVHIGPNTWVDGVMYRNAEGMEFVRYKIDFDLRFRPQ